MFRMTRNSQGCEFPAEGAHRAASRIFSISSSGTGLSSRKPERILRRPRTTSRKASIDTASIGPGSPRGVSKAVIQALLYHTAPQMRADCADFSHRSGIHIWFAMHPSTPSIMACPKTPRRKLHTSMPTWRSVEQQPGTLPICCHNVSQTAVKNLASGEQRFVLKDKPNVNN